MAETEKLTINLSIMDLGQIDLLVEEGFYTNRTDMIRTAIRRELSRHDEVIKQSTVRLNMVMGVLVYTKDGLEKRLAKGEKLKIRVVGMLVIANDVPAELADATIESVVVLGSFRASKAVKEVLADRIK
ncbi:MAG: hypothetical protein KDE09_14420 [Anaerolineales bacterium]|nr:hypothetical protein [Anaerolineales bacterium]MCB0005443.1 hypothetical protein [Anaerolineales bacterium]MCB0013568.1 hypothetical protein [Anaerolineales bacterium]MCB0018982.1 hypothetical protein [Anaerolineales bacterium]